MHHGFQNRSAVILIAVLAGSLGLLSPVWAKQSSTLKAEVQVRVSSEDGLVTTIFHMPSGGKVSAFLPLNVQQGEAQIGGSVERQMPHPSPDLNVDQATAEIAGDVTIEHKKKQPNIPPVQVPPNQSDFTCAPSDDGDYTVTYRPPKGPPCTTSVHCPPPTQTCPPSDTCTIPQLTTSGGNMHVSMLPPNGSDPADNTCVVGGHVCPCRAWSKEGCVFHVPPPSQVALGSAAVMVSRGHQSAEGLTHVAQVKMVCTPNHLKPGQPCTVTTTVICPGLNSVRGGQLIIKNYDPSVLVMPDHVIPIPYSP